MNNLLLAADIPAVGIFFIAAVATFFGMFILVPIFFGAVRMFGLYTIVEERQCKVYMLFGKVVATIDEPGLHILIFKLGLKAPLVNFLGKCHTLDLRMDQEYIRSTRRQFRGRRADGHRHLV